MDAGSHVAPWHAFCAKLGMIRTAQEEWRNSNNVRGKMATGQDHHTGQDHSMKCSSWSSSSKWHLREACINGWWCLLTAKHLLMWCNTEGSTHQWLVIVFEGLTSQTLGDTEDWYGSTESEITKEVVNVEPSTIPRCDNKNEGHCLPCKVLVVEKMTPRCGGDMKL